MLRFPSPLHDGEGVIAEVLGPRGKPGVDTLSIIREFNLPERFAEDAIEEARQQAEAFDESIGGRKDFTGETIVTIDPVDARDFDDAISLEKLDDGALAAGRPYRRRVAFRPAEDPARPRGAGTGHERLSARPRAADAARGDLERPGEPSAGQGSLHEIGRDGVNRGGHAGFDRALLGGHPQQQAAHLRAG